MRQSCVVVFAFVLILCCKQDDERNGFWYTDKDRIKGKRVIPSVVTRAHLNKGGFSRTGKSRFVGQDDNWKKVILTPEQAYAYLELKLEELKALYNYRPLGFNVSLFDDLEGQFQVEEMQNFKDSVYAVLNGNVTTIGNLQRIVMHSVKNTSDYLFEKNSRPLIEKLSSISWHTVFAVILENGEVLNSVNLSKLKSMGNMRNLNEINSMLRDMCTKWKKIVDLICGLIDEVVKFAVIGVDNREIIEFNLNPIIRLNCLVYNQSCPILEDGVRILQLEKDGIEICKLKNDLRRLRMQIKDKILEIIS
ncbi:hypothetical protein [Borrelia persica]|uniref:hypothetical protein n=1 Tax=Borrelia persica TaxID=44448 RepID=UPI000464518E|nr:hypothetical protein [Borrelia persica]